MGNGKRNWGLVGMTSIVVSDLFMGLCTGKSWNNRSAAWAGREKNNIARVTDTDKRRNHVSPDIE